MAFLAGGWFAKFLESVPVWVVIGVTLRASRTRLFHAELLGVALVASELGVAAAQVEARPRPMVELEFFQAAIFWRVTPIAGLLVEEHVFVRRTMTPRVAAVTGFGPLQIELRLGMAFAARHVFVSTLLREFCIALLVVVKLKTRLRRLPRNLRVATLAL